MRSEELAKLTRVGYPTPSGASLRHDEDVGDDALGVPLEGVRFVFFSQAMQGDKGCRGVGTSRAPSPTNALCGYSGLL